MSNNYYTNKYDMYYDNLKDFYNVKSPDNISNEANNIAKDIKAIKDQLFELSGKMASGVDDAVTDLKKTNNSWKTYTDEALIPATKKVPELKTLLEERKKFISTNSNRLDDQYLYKAEFADYLRGNSDNSINNREYHVINYIDEKIDNKISEIRKLAKVTEYRSLPIDPVDQPLYGVIEPTIQPAYGVEPLDPIQIGAQPLYGVMEPEPFEPYLQAEYGVKETYDSTQ